MEFFEVFNELDWVLLVIIFLSTLVGISRGMVREIFALVGWCAAFFVSLFYAQDLAPKLPMGSVGPMVRTIISIVLIVIGCVFVAGLIGKILRNLLSSISIGAEDRILGCLFGFLRGLLVVGVLVYLCGSIQYISSQTWWRASVVVPWIEKGIVACAPYIPEEILHIKDNVK